MKKVLVIEDNEDNLRLMNYVLTHAGYKVIEAKTGEEGIVFALKEHPYFIIMDINLPGIDGIETTKRIRNSEAGWNIPIFAVTARAMAGDKELVLSAGCNGYFEKPINPLTIVEKILQEIEKN